MHKTLPLGDIVSFAAVRNSWASGFGIHYFPGGVLWNASGLSAVEFKMANGRYVRIGTAEPDAFVAAVRQATGRADVPHEVFDGSRSNIRNIIGIAAGIIAMVVTGVVVYTGFQPPVVRVTDRAVSVSNGVYRDTLPFDTMQSLTLESSIPKVGLKTNGFSARNTLRGSFRVDGWGSSRLGHQQRRAAVCRHAYRRDARRRQLQRSRADAAPVSRSSGADGGAPMTASRRYDFLVETYRTERLKTLGVWSQIPDARMQLPARAARAVAARAHGASVRQREQLDARHARHRRRPSGAAGARKRDRRSSSITRRARRNVSMSWRGSRTSGSSRRRSSSTSSAATRGS